MLWAPYLDFNIEAVGRTNPIFISEIPTVTYKPEIAWKLWDSNTGKGKILAPEIRVLYMYSKKCN
jgi:hypothetical protein